MKYYVTTRNIQLFAHKQKSFNLKNFSYTYLIYSKINYL